MFRSVFLVFAEIAMGGQRHNRSRGWKLFLPAVWCFRHFLHISDPALAVNLSLPSNPLDRASAIRTNLQERTVKQLQAELRERGLPVSGRKAALVDRLLEIKTTKVWVRQLLHIYYDWERGYGSAKSPFEPAKRRRSRYYIRRSQEFYEETAKYTNKRISKLQQLLVPNARAEFQIDIVDKQIQARGGRA